MTPPENPYTRLARVVERVDALEAKVAELERAQADADARMKPAPAKRAAPKAKG